MEPNIKKERNHLAVSFKEQYSSLRNEFGNEAASLYARLYKALNGKGGFTNTAYLFFELCFDDFKEIFRSEIRATEDKIRYKILEMEELSGHEVASFFSKLFDATLKRKEELVLGFECELSLPGLILDYKKSMNIYRFKRRINDYGELLHLFDLLLDNIVVFFSPGLKNKREYIDLIDRIACLHLESGLRFANTMCDIYELTPLNEIRKMGHEQTIQPVIREYTNCVSFLLESNKPDYAKDYEPDRLLNRILDNKNRNLIIDSIHNSIFLNYVYEGRLPAYSWSARSGEEMMRALTTGDYEKSYKAERQLIDRVNRDIYSRQPLGK